MTKSMVKELKKASWPSLLKMMAVVKCAIISGMSVND